MKSILVILAFLILLVSFAGDAKKTSYEGIPVFTSAVESNICKKYQLSDFQRLQIMFGKKVANSAFHCKAHKMTSTMPIPTALVGIDPESSCGLQITADSSYIDPCSMRTYDEKGKCTSDNCELELFQIYTNAFEGTSEFLIPDSELASFADDLFTEDLSLEESLVLAMTVNADNRIEKILASDNIDVNYKSKDGVSLFQLAVFMGSKPVLKYLLENKVDVCVTCKETQRMLLYSLRSGSLAVSELLIKQGVSTEGMCEKLLPDLNARELLRCDAN